MKKPVMYLSLFISLFLLSCSDIVNETTPVEQSAAYTLTIDVIWDSASHPVETFPSDIEGSMAPHVSPFIGGVHAEGVSLWTDGALASEAVKSSAETGSPLLLRAVVEDLIAKDSAKEVIFSGGTSSPALSTIEIDADLDNYNISFMSMIAPSPDWFFGVDSYSLIQNGNWISSSSIDPHPYDAGTKDGEEYLYDFDATNPAEPIRSLSGIAPFSDQPVARVTFTKK